MNKQTHQQQEHDPGTASIGAAVDYGMAQLAQAVSRLAGAAEGVAGAAREASVALMLILQRAGNLCIYGCQMEYGGVNWTRFALPRPLTDAPTQ